MKVSPIILIALAANARAQTPTVGSTLPRWTAGTLDIHQISTGRGNSALIVMPDGTTLLIDAGAAADGIAETDPHPDASRAPGDWIARYVKRHMPDSVTGLDYALITHFHADHFGQLLATSPASANGNYKQFGITQVGDAIPIRRLLDRGWPDYQYPVPFTDSSMAHYRRFLDAQRARGMSVARFQAGSRSQIAQTRNAQTYPTFEVRNIVGNGDVWIGRADSSRALFPPLATIPKADWPNENMCSLGLRISYGPFRFFTGGDLPGTPDPGFPAWHSLESGVAHVVGRVDVHVVNMHGSMGEESEPFLAALASSVVIIPSWAPSHPAPDVLKRIVNSRLAPESRSIFVTDLRPSARTVIGQRANAPAGPPGHIVVRVEAGGARYWVFVLSNNDERDTIVAVKGPFTSGK
jgi:beta-lactamase superfamily II metal-dependent hydrolase